MKFGQGADTNHGVCCSDTRTSRAQLLPYAGEEAQPEAAAVARHLELPALGGGRDEKQRSPELSLTSGGPSFTAQLHRRAKRDVRVG